MTRAWVAIAACGAVAMSGAAAGIGCGAATKKVRLGPESTCASLKACETECEGGTPSGCRRLGERYNSGNGVPTDEARALVLFRRACDGGDGEGCELAAATIALTDEGAARPLYQRAAKLYEGACEAGDAGACGDLGMLIDNGRGGLKKDPARSLALYRRSCEAGSSEGCFYVGMAYDDGKGTKPSSEEAARWYEKSCDMGDPDACGIAANFFDDGTLECDVDKARELRKRAADGYEKQCDEGDDWGCWSAASEWDFGIGLPEDKERATSILTKGCGGNGRHSCAALADRLEKGEGAAVDRERALDLHRKACEYGEDDSCVGAWRLLAALGRVEEADGYAQKALAMREKWCRRGGGSAMWCQRAGEMYDKGQGVKIDREKAAEYTRLAIEARKRKCLDGAGYECGQAAQIFSDGKGVAADPALAADLWRRACEAAPYYCSEAGERFEKGKGVPAVDKAAAVAAYQHGCDFDIARSCIGLANIIGDPKRAEELRSKFHSLSRTCEQPEDIGDGDDGDGDDGDWDGEADPCAGD